MRPCGGQRQCRLVLGLVRHVHPALLLQAPVRQPGAGRLRVQQPAGSLVKPTGVEGGRGLCRVGRSRRANRHGGSPRRRHAAWACSIQQKQGEGRGRVNPLGPIVVLSDVRGLLACQFSCTAQLAAPPDAANRNGARRRQRSARQLGAPTMLSAPPAACACAVWQGKGMRTWLEGSNAEDRRGACCCRCLQLERRLL